MEFSKELIEKAMKAKSAEDLIKLAKEEGAEISADDAKKLLEKVEKGLGGAEIPDDIKKVASGLFDKAKKSGLF